MTDEGSEAKSSVEAAGPLQFRYCGPQAECSNVDVPLDWTQPEGQRANVFFKRIHGTAPLHKQVWFASGGPGALGGSLETWRAA